MYKQFYQHLGDLLFVVTDIEGLMTRLEKNNLLKVIGDLLFAGSGDEAPRASPLKVHPVAALNSFLDFVDENYRFFDEHLLKAGAIASQELWDVYRFTSKKEKRLVAELLHKFSA
jgi:hypothetical protein